MLRELQETNAALQDVRELLRQQVRTRVGRQGVGRRGKRPGRGLGLEEWEKQVPVERERVLGTKIRGGSCRREGEGSPKGRRFRGRRQGSMRG